MKQLEVQIMGQSYLLGCPDEGDARLLAAVQQVDSAMCKIRDAGKVRARDRIAVLAAVNLAFDFTEQRLHQTVALAPTESGRAQASSERLGSLLARLDDALNRDNQLL